MWQDVVAVLQPPRRFSHPSHPDGFELVVEDDRILVLDGTARAAIDYEQLFDAWQYLRTFGFLSRELAPASLEDRAGYLLPLLASLPYVRSVRVSEDEGALQAAWALGVQYFPGGGHSMANAPLPRVEAVLNGAHTVLQQPLFA
jgi:hypothetical protein